MTTPRPDARPEEREPFDPADWPDRFVKLMPDICADGVWDREGVGCTCDSLPISDALVARIRAWQEAYDDADDASNIVVVEMWDGFDWPAFQREAEAIAAELRSELPGWEVVCSDKLGLRAYLLEQHGAARPT